MSEKLETIRIAVFPKTGSVELHSFQIRSSMSTIPVTFRFVSHIDNRIIETKLSGRGKKTGHYFYKEI